ncbi:NTP transferase domain-containing protein [bacterium]|nr:NTP transferase domain-containing protein [bacterium]
MRAVIMAGGFGRRLRPLTSRLPKPMVPIVNRPIMHHVINLLKKAGIGNAVSLLYYQPDYIRDYFGDGSQFDFKMDYCMAKSDLGTAGSVRNAKDMITDRMLVISGDVLTDFDLKDVIRFHEEKCAIATIVLTRVQNPLAFGIVIVDEDGRIVRFLEKPRWGEVFSDTINTGIYILEPEIFDYIPEGREFDFSKDLYPLLLKEKLPLFGYIAKGYWRDVGNLIHYRMANLDALRDLVDIEVPGAAHKQKDALIFSDSPIPDEVRFAGTVVLGKDVKIGRGASLSECVIGDGTVLGAGSSVSRAVIWKNSTVGENCSISGAIIADSVCIGSGVVIHENAVVSDGCHIGDRVSILPGVKIWPQKIIEEGTTVSTSLVWGERLSGELFVNARITGLANLEISPEFAAKLGAAVGAKLGKRKTVVVSRDADPASRMVQRALVSGFLSAGVDVEDIGLLPIPVTRFHLSSSGRAVAGIYTRKSPRNVRLQDIIFFDGAGRDMSVATCRAIERLFAGEEFPRASFNEIGKVFYPTRTQENYRDSLLEHIDMEAFVSADLRVVIDYSFGGAANIFPSIIGATNVDVVSLNAYVDTTRVARTRDELLKTLSQLSTIVVSLGASAGFMIDPSGESISIVDDTGRVLTPDEELLTVAKLVMDVAPPKKMAAPISASMGLDRLARDFGVELIHTKNDHLSMMEAVSVPGVEFVGGTRGGFIFTDFSFACDGMYAIMKILELLAKTGVTLSEIRSQIRTYFRAEGKVFSSWEKKGYVMRRLIEQTAGQSREVLDGVRILFPDGWILVIPDSEKPFFYLFSEATTLQRAESLVAEYSNLLEKWQKE